MVVEKSQRSEYLREKGIEELFRRLTIALILEKPDDHLSTLIQWLQTGNIPDSLPQIEIKSFTV